MDVVGLTLWGFMLETLFYGIYILVFGMSMYVRLWHADARIKRSGGAMSLLMDSLALIVFCLITAHWVSSVIRIHRAVSLLPGTPGAAIGYLVSFNNGTWVASVITHALARICMDMLLAARVYVLYNYKLGILVMFALLLLGDLTGSIAICVYSVLFPSWTSAQFTILQDWVISVYTISCGTNLLASSMIIYRVVSQNRVLKEFNIRTALLPVLMVVIESASIYSAFSVVLLALFLSPQRPAVYLVLQLVSPLVGIVYSLIILQVGLGLNVRDRRRTRSSSSAGGVSQPVAIVNGRTRRESDAPLPLGTLKFATSTRSSSEDAVKVDFDSKGMPMGLPPKPHVEV